MSSEDLSDISNTYTIQCAGKWTEFNVYLNSSEPELVYTAITRVLEERQPDVQLRTPGMSNTSPMVAFWKKRHLSLKPNLIGLGDPQDNPDVEYLKKRFLLMPNSEWEFETTETPDGGRQKFVWRRRGHLHGSGWTEFECTVAETGAQVARARYYIKFISWGGIKDAEFRVIGLQSERFVRLLLVSWFAMNH